MCEADMNVNFGAKKTISLSNDLNENNDPVLKWIEPCPKVNWANELKNDRKFLINIDNIDATSKTVKPFKVTVFNPLASQSKNFTALQSKGRLLTVMVEYKQIGRTTWSTAQTTNSVTGNTADMDYLSSFTVEDGYGFASLEWLLDGVSEGNYEIKVGTKCQSSGGPEELDGYSEPAITGVYDITRPEMYGKPTPLRNDIIVGEEISIFFTERMFCTLPLTFEVEVVILGTEYILHNKDLFIICEGRKIGIQINLSVGIEVSKIIGKEFTVEIGKISSSLSKLMDSNKNPMDPLVKNIKFKKRFAQLDLSSVKTAFQFTMTNGTCSQQSLQAQPNDVREQIASLIGISSIDRVQLSKMSCQNGSTIMASAQIMEINQVRHLRNSLSDLDSTALFYKFRNALENQNDTKERKLMHRQKGNAFNIMSMRISASSQDMRKFAGSVKEKEEEDQLLEYAKIESEINDAYATVKDDMPKMNHNDLKVLRSLGKQEMDEHKEQKDEINLLISELRKKDEEMKKKDEEMKKKDEEMKKEVVMIKKMLKELVKVKKD